MSQFLFEIQFKVLPVGTLLLLAVFAMLWLYRRRLSPRTRVIVVASGALGGLLAVGLFYAIGLIPWAMPCLNCLESDEHYSVLLTFVQGWGFASAAALCWMSISRKRPRT